MGTSFIIAPSITSARRRSADASRIWWRALSTYSSVSARDCGHAHEALDPDRGAARRMAFGLERAVYALAHLAQVLRPAPAPGEHRDVAPTCAQSRWPASLSPATQMGGMPADRSGADVGRRHRVVRAVVAERLRRERGVQHVEELLEHRARLGEVDAEPFELVGLVARADAEHEAAAGETVDHPDLREHPGRLVERGDDDGGCEPHPFGDRGAVRGHDEG